MGCGACRILSEENYNIPIDSNLQLIKLTKKDDNLTLLNDLYKNAILILEMIELMRETVYDKLDELIYYSGACVFITPDISLCIQSILWNLSANFEGNINKAQIQFIEDEPFLIIDSVSNAHINLNLKHTISLFVSYLSDLFSLNNQIKKIDEKIPQLVYITSENNDNYLLGQSKEEINTQIYLNMNNNKVTSIIKSNNIKIKKAIHLFQEIVIARKNIIESIAREFKGFNRSPKYKIKIDQVGVEAYTKGIEDICDIAYLSKSVYKEIQKKEELNDFNKLYHGSANEGKNKYLNFIENKNYVKQKRQREKEVEQ